MPRTKQEHIAAFDDATRRLMTRVSTMKIPPEFKPLYNMSDVVYKFRSAFLIPELRHAVLAKKYESERISSGRFAAGFCGIACGRVYRLSAAGIGAAVADLPDNLCNSQSGVFYQFDFL